MMKKLIIFLLFVSSFIQAQTNELTGTFAVTSATGTDPTFTVQGYFNSTVGFDASDVIVGDLLIVRHVSGTTHRRNIYNITSVSSSGSNLTIGVTRLTGTSTSFFPPGTHAISRKTANGLIYDVANTSQELEGYIYNYDLGLIEGWKVDTLTVDADTLTLTLEDGTTFDVTLSSGGSGANLASSPSTTTVTVTSDSGTDAVIQAATASQAGVLTATDYSLLQSTITSFSGDVTGVISLGNANLNINADVITTVELANDAVETANIAANQVALTKMVDAPANTILGNNTGSSADPVYMTAAQAKALLSIDDLVTLSGVADGATNLGTFTGSTIVDNQTVKAALQSLETSVEGKLSTTLTSANIYVGNGSNIATAQSVSGDATLSNTGVLTVNKQADIQFQDEGVNRGTSGEVTTVDFTGAGVTATHSAGTLTVDITSGGGSGIDTITSTNNTIDITEVTSTQYDIDVNMLPFRALIDTCYAVTISGGNVGSVLWVCANGGGVTASFSSNKLTITGSSAARVKAAYWTLVSADVQASADAGGITNWVQVEFAGCRGNSSLTDLRIPAVTKTAIPTSGSLSTSNAASVDIDNNPVVSVVGVGSNSLTMRVGGLSAVGGQGYQLSFAGVH